MAETKRAWWLLCCLIDRVPCWSCAATLQVVVASAATAVNCIPALRECNFSLVSGAGHGETLMWSVDCSGK